MHLLLPHIEAVSYTHLDVYKRQELRKLIGSRVKQRRLELNLTQPYVAEKMGVTASTILRDENGSIDNTKKMVLEGLSEALHVSVEWLKGETDEYETDITDKSCLLYTSIQLCLNVFQDSFYTCLKEVGMSKFNFLLVTPFVNLP